MYDKNDDGHIDFKEFMMVLYVMSNGTPEENLRKIFRIFDMNSDGLLSKQELTRIVKDLYMLFAQPQENENQEELASKAFQEMDSNADDKVTEEEFVKACLSNKSITQKLTLKVIDLFTPTNDS